MSWMKLNMKLSHDQKVELLNFSAEILDKITTEDDHSITVVDGGDQILAAMLFRKVEQMINDAAADTVRAYQTQVY